jgi:hypothetical protein
VADHVGGADEDIVDGVDDGKKFQIPKGGVDGGGKKLDVRGSASVHFLSFASPVRYFEYLVIVMLCCLSFFDCPVELSVFLLEPAAWDCPLECHQKDGHLKQVVVV